MSFSSLQGDAGEYRDPAPERMSVRLRLRMTLLDKGFFSSDVVCKTPCIPCFSRQYRARALARPPEEPLNLISGSVAYPSHTSRMVPQLFFNSLD